jgi:2-keto-4-pentenoate hydratase
MLDSDVGLAEMLRNACAGGELPPVPSTEPALADAYAIQRAVFVQGDVPIAGWKIGLTAEPPRVALGADSPAAGRLAAADILPDGSRIGFSGAEMYAEAELVVELARDLPPVGAPYSREAVAAAVGSVRSGIEIVRSRFASTELSLGLLVADNVMAHALVVGEPVSQGWQTGYGDMDAVLERLGEERVEGSTTRVMGDPLNALVWLANWLCEQEGGLKAGQLVATGTCTGATEIHAGDTVVVQLGDLGKAQVSITDGAIEGDKK